MTQIRTYPLSGPSAQTAIDRALGQGLFQVAGESVSMRSTHGIQTPKGTSQSVGAGLVQCQDGSSLFIVDGKGDGSDVDALQVFALADAAALAQIIPEVLSTTV